MSGGMDREVMKGKILDAWIADLRADCEPRTMPEMKMLSSEELEDVMRLARWYKASFLASESVQTSVDVMADRLRERVYEDRASEFVQVAKISADAVTFGSALQAARTRLDVEPDALEQAYSLPGGTLGQLESGRVPPHRVAKEKMTALLQGLRFSRQVVDLIRRSCLEWAVSVYGQAQTQMGRIDPSLTNSERLNLLQDAAGQADEGLAKELEQIRQYCSSLETRLL